MTQIESAAPPAHPGPGDENGEGGEAPLTGEALLQDTTARLEEDIVFGRLHPRERLIEEDLSRQLGVKRHVVRQAIVELERLGLVERARNRGAVVKLYTVKEVQDINAVRELLEGEAARLIPLPLSAEALERLRRWQRVHAEAVETGDRPAVFRANIAFHEELFSHCGNAALIEAIRAYAQKSHAYRSIFVNDDTYLRWAAGAHGEMLEAIASEDRESLVRLCLAHLAPAMEHYIGTIRARQP